ncbi:MAG: motif putative anchor domain protein, partial [Proteobacteria bacterium]|nr:motif putative anchor domain protein [Pseudomonadota bacterium]
MKRNVSFAVVLLGLMFGSQAFAHVGYRDLNALNPFTASVTADHGWAAGANGTTWGDSHAIRWFSFNLTQDSLVNISVANTGAGTFPNYGGNGVQSATAPTFTSVGDIDVGFSLYRNLLPTAAFEGATNAAYITDTNPTGLVYSVADHAPAGSTGLFNALGDVTMGNNS